MLSARLQNPKQEGAMSSCASTYQAGALDSLLRNTHISSTIQGEAARRRPRSALERNTTVSFRGHNKPCSETARQILGFDRFGAIAVPQTQQKSASRRPPLSSASQTPVAERRFPVPTQPQQEKEERVRGLVGLQNLGNTCFINTCVQCLMSLEPFSNFFLENNHMFRLDTASSMKGTLALSFGEILHKMWLGRRFSSVSPGVLKERVSKFAPQFTGYRQHDAQEFLRFLLDGLHEDLRVNIDVNPADGSILAARSDEELAMMLRVAGMQYAGGGYSSVIGAFGGQLVSTITCMECGRRSATLDPFLDLSLPVPAAAQVREGDGERQSCSLLRCFAEFTEAEILDGDDAYCCDTCGCRQRATKQLLLGHCPPVLVVHVKRFCQTATGREKLITDLFFPETGLDLSPYMAEGVPDPAPYELKAIALHVGGIGGGHYHALCLKSDDRRWYQCNDSTVRPASLAGLDGSQPYILFYQQQGAPSVIC